MIEACGISAVSIRRQKRGSTLPQLTLPETSVHGPKQNKKRVKERITLYGEIHDRATERHLPYGITQCYLPPDTGERAPP